MAVENNVKKSLGLVALLACGLTLTAYADDPSNTTTVNGTASSSKTENVSATSLNKSLLQTLHDKVEFSYFGIYRGASVSDPGNSLQPDTQGNPDITAPQGVESYVTTGYKPDKNTVVGVTWHFFTNAVSSQGPENQAVGSGQEWLNPMLMVSRANLIKSGGFALKGYMYATLPMSNYDYISEPGHNMITELTPTVNMTYDIPGTRWTIGNYAYVGAYIAGPNTADGLRTYKFYDAPYLNYQATPRLAATLWVDLIQATRAQGTPFIAGMSNPTADVEPGFAYDIIPGKLTVNPVVNIYPNQPTLAATSFQAVIIGRAW